MSDAPPASVARVAELASELARFDPSAPGLVRELFKAFSEVQDHFRAPQPIATAPHVAGAPIFLFCPSQDGWQVGKWVFSGSGKNSGADGRWVASIDETKHLEPTHWMRPEPDPVEKPSGQAAA